tara:strand:- start:1613 stop:1798 length:186 start_codon:yes stop_codon:yes gene_type:complete
MAKKPLEISKNAKMGLGVVNARYLPTNITLPEAPWESSDEDSDVGFRDVLRQGLQPIKDDD